MLPAILSATGLSSEAQDQSMSIQWIQVDQQLQRDSRSATCIIVHEMTVKHAVVALNKGHIRDSIYLAILSHVERSSYF